MSGLRVTRAPETLLPALEGAGRVLLTGPVNPDGDSIGACLALQHILRARGVDAHVAGDPGYRYGWLPAADQMIPDQRLTGHFDAVVVMDGDRHRLTPEAEAAFHGAEVRAIVDHHASTKQDGYTHFWVEPNAGSTCEMVYSALDAWGQPIDADIAALLYTGVIFDTGGFRYSNTTPATHRMAAELLATGIDHHAICTRVLMERSPNGLRAKARILSQARFHHDGAMITGEVPRSLWDELSLVQGDIEGIVDALVFTTGVEVAVLFIERADGSIKCSLRSRGRINVAEVAQTVAPSGGGHAKAAGVSLPVSMSEMVDILVTSVGEAV